MFVTGSSDRSVGVWDLASRPLRNEAADELEALAEFKMKQEGEWSGQLVAAKAEEAKLVTKLDNDEASDDDERVAMGRQARGSGSDKDSIDSADLLESSSESSLVSSQEEDEGDSGDVSTTDSDDPEREKRTTVWDKEQRLLDRLLGERDPPRPNELKVRVNRKGRLAGVGYK